MCASSSPELAHAEPFPPFCAEPHMPLRYRGLPLKTKEKKRPHKLSISEKEDSRVGNFIYLS